MKWGIVVGKPKPEGWEKSDSDPDLTNVGQWVIGGGFNDHDSEVVLFDTSEQAQEEADRMSQTNDAWNYEVKKYVLN